MSAPYLLERDHVSLTLAWSKVHVAEFYELEMSTDAAEWVSLSNSLKGTSIRKKNLVEGVAYRFRIRCNDGNGWSNYSPSSEGYFVLASNVHIMDPPEISARDDVSLTLQWKEVAGAEGYQLRYRSDEDAAVNASNCWARIESTIKSTTVRKKGLKAGVNYQFAVIPVLTDSAGNPAAWSYSLSSAPGKVLTLPPFMQKLFPTTLIAGNKKVVPTASLIAGKCIAIYFSAHWCGPCRQFTPKLLELYAQCKAANKRFEIIFCSADNSEQEFHQYHAAMTWPAIAYDEEHREGIMGMFKVSGIPRLVVMSASGKVVAENAISGAPLSTAVVDQWIAMSDSMK